MIHRCRPFIDLEKFCNDVISFNSLSADYVSDFETAFSKYLDSPLSIATSQGRAALFLAINILDIKKGDEVIVQSFTCRTAIDPLIQIGAKVQLVDIDANFNIPIKNLQKIISKKVKVIIATHLYGVPCNIEEISEFAKNNNCYLIEDCCQCLGAIYNDKKIGRFGDISIFSFNIDKPFSLGDGGMAVINNENLFDKAINIKNKFKQVPLTKEKEILYGLLIYNIITDAEIYKNELSMDYIKELLSYDKNLLKTVNKKIFTHTKLNDLVVDLIGSINNSKKTWFKVMEEIKKINSLIKLESVNSKQILMNLYRAKIGVTQLKLYNNLIKIRNNNSIFYSEILKNSNMFMIPKINNKIKPAFLRYSIINRTKYSVSHISKTAKIQGFEIGNYNWSKPIHMKLPYSSIIAHSNKELYYSEYLSNNVINLPIHNYVKYKDILNICNFLKTFE
jgi:perosamine synthetase